jgi:hypothetical protein
LRKAGGAQGGGWHGRGELGEFCFDLAGVDTSGAIVRNEILRYGRLGTGRGLCFVEVRWNSNFRSWSIRILGAGGILTHVLRPATREKAKTERLRPEAGRNLRVEPGGSWLASGRALRWRAQQASAPTNGEELGIEHGDSWLAGWRALRWRAQPFGGLGQTSSAPTDGTARPRGHTAARRGWLSAPAGHIANSSLFFGADCGWLRRARRSYCVNRCLLPYHCYYYSIGVKRGSK